MQMLCMMSYKQLEMTNQRSEVPVSGSGGVGARRQKASVGGRKVNI